MITNQFDSQGVSFFALGRSRSFDYPSVEMPGSPPPMSAEERPVEALSGK